MRPGRVEGGNVYTATSVIAIACCCLFGEDTFPANTPHIVFGQKKKDIQKISSASFWSIFQN